MLDNTFWVVDLYLKDVGLPMFYGQKISLRCGKPPPAVDFVMLFADDVNSYISMLLQFGDLFSLLPVNTCDLYGLQDCHI